MNNSLENIIIATIREWNIENYFSLKVSYEKEFNFYLFTSSEELCYENIKKINPKYIFFPHWSWIIPDNIYNNFECVVFHMTDLPYGRGGSPLQNLIMNNVYSTKITAIKVNKEMDSGDIYLKEDFDISIGSAEEIFINASNIIFNKMIPKFLLDDLIAIKQIGEIITFKRRDSNQSDINKLEIKSLDKVYDFIRMLDAPGYPNAYLDLEGLKINFLEVHRKSGKLVGRFEVIEDE